jgi:predicted amidophosphoribosyltransferase
VRAWKERGLRTLAPAAADEIAYALSPPSGAAGLAFVPPDRARGLERGHHPTERLARELGDRWDLPVLSVLGRTRPISRQRGLSLADRRRNVAGAFAPSCRTPARLVLVDDVYTSGSTVGAAATALRKGGARRVDVVTFARVVR